MSRMSTKSWLGAGLALAGGGALAAAALGVGVAAFTFSGPALAQEKAALDLAPTFKERRENWVRKSKEGSLKRDWQIKVVKTYPGGAEPKFTPEPGGLYVYVNTGAQNWGPVTRYDEKNTNKFNRINVINAKTKELIASNQITDASAFSHFTAATPDGKYIYMEGGGSYSSPDTAILWKIDALTLEPVVMLNVGGTVHHMQVLRDNMMLVDMFSTQESTGVGRTVFLLDPNTNESSGSIASDDLGGTIYTAWAGPTPEHEAIYLLMEPKYPKGWGSSSGVYHGTLMTWPTYWVAKVDPDTMTVLREYPYPGARSDWIAFSPDGGAMYVDGYMNDTVMKIDLTSGELVWGTDVGTGPYAIEVIADGSEVWVTDKGEAGKRHKGRTITVVSADKGAYINTIVYGGRGVDHVQLSPDGKEMWATANDNGTVYAIDVATHQVIAAIPLPGFGDPHGPVFVYYDKDGKSCTVADQADFHCGIDPRNGRPLAN